MATDADDHMSDIIKTLQENIESLQAEREVFNREKLREILDIVDRDGDNDPRVDQMVLEHKEGLTLFTQKVKSRLKLIVSPSLRNCQIVVYYHC
jgi:hypothetical protein